MWKHKENVYWNNENSSRYEDRNGTTMATTKKHKQKKILEIKFLGSQTKTSEVKSHQHITWKGRQKLGNWWQDRKHGYLHQRQCKI